MNEGSAMSGSAGGGVGPAPAGGSGYGKAILDAIQKLAAALKTLGAARAAGSGSSGGTVVNAGPAKTNIPFVNTYALNAASAKAAREVSVATSAWAKHITTAQQRLLATLGTMRNIKDEVAKILAGWQLVTREVKNGAYWRGYRGTESDLVSRDSSITSAPPRPPKATKAPTGGDPLPGSPKGGWGSSLARQAQYWGQLRLLYAGFNKAREGARTYTDMITGAARASRTATTDLRDLGELWQAQQEIADAATDYFKRHVGSISDYTEAVYHLTSAQMKRAEALKVAPVVMAASVGLDAPIKETAQLAVSMNELFKGDGGTDSGRIGRMLSVMALAVKNEVVELDDLRLSMSYVAPVAKECGMSFEEMTAAVGLLSTNLMQGSKAGTGLRQMLNAIAKNQDKLEKLGIAFDPTKPLQFTKIMGELAKVIGEGSIPADTLKDLFGVFNVRGVTSAAILGQQFGEFVADVQKLKAASMGDLFGMRDVMENNVPAQFAILSQNVNLITASLLRGALGGRDMADSLKNVNVAVSGLIPVAQSLGGALSNTFGNKLVQQSLIAAAGYALLAKRIAAVQMASKTAAAGGAAMGWAAKVGTFMGGPVGIATTAIAGLTALAYLQERQAAQHEEAIRRSSEAQGTYTDEATRLKALSVALAESGQALGDNASNADLLAQANTAIAAAADKANAAIGGKAGTLRAASEQLAKLSGTYARMAKLEAGLQYDTIQKKHGASWWEGMKPGWMKWIESGSPTGVQAAPAMADVQALPALLEDLRKLRDAGQAAGKSMADISLAANGMFAGVHARLATAATAVQQEIGRSNEEEAARWGGVLDRITAAQGILSDATKNLFTEQAVAVKKSGAALDAYVRKLEALRSQFDMVPDATLQDKLSALDVSDLDPLDKGIERAKLLKEGIGALAAEMEAARVAAYADTPATPEEAKEAEITIKNQLEQHQKLYKERAALEHDLARQVLDNEHAVREAAEKTAKDREEATRKLIELQARAGKLARDVQAETMVGFGTLFAKMNASEEAAGKDDWKKKRLDRYKELTGQGVTSKQAAATARKEVPAPLPFYIEQARHDLEARFAGNAAAQIKRSAFGGIPEGLAKSFDAEKAGRLIAALGVGPERYFKEQGTTARAKYGTEGEANVETEAAGFRTWLSGFLKMAPDSAAFADVWKKGFGSVVESLPKWLQGATSGEAFSNALLGKPGDIAGTMQSLQGAISESSQAQRDLTSATMDLAMLMGGPTRSVNPWVDRFTPQPMLSLGVPMRPMMATQSAVAASVATGSATVVNLFIDGTKVGEFVTKAGMAINAQGIVAENAAAIAGKSIERWSRADADAKAHSR